MALLLALGIGTGVGLIVGALGAGGGILSVPVLVYVLGQSPHQAASGSLVIVLVTALAALPSRARHGQVRWRDGALFGLEVSHPFRVIPQRRWMPREPPAGRTVSTDREWAKHRNDRPDNVSVRCFRGANRNQRASRVRWHRLVPFP